MALDMEERAMKNREAMESSREKAPDKTSGSSGSGYATGGLSGAQTDPDDF
jgi:hypothetical protein